MSCRIAFSTSSEMTPLMGFAVCLNKLLHELDPNGGVNVDYDSSLQALCPLNFFRNDSREPTTFTITSFKSTARVLGFLNSNRKIA